MMAAALRHERDADAAAVAVRSIRRRELLRVASADVLGCVDLAQTGEALTAVTSGALEAALAVDGGAGGRADGQAAAVRFAVIAMGRYGGHETGYGSDADVVFVSRPAPGPGRGR